MARHPLGWPTGPGAADHGWAAPSSPSGSAGCSPGPVPGHPQAVAAAGAAPPISLRTLHRRVGEVAARLVSRGDPDRDQILADLHQQLRDLPTGAVLLA